MFLNKNAGQWIMFKKSIIAAEKSVVPWNIPDIATF
jgi:hypothetical protein